MPFGIGELPTGAQSTIRLPGVLLHVQPARLLQVGDLRTVNPRPYSGASRLRFQAQCPVQQVFRVDMTPVRLSHQSLFSHLCSPKVTPGSHPRERVCPSSVKTDLFCQWSQSHNDFSFTQ
jgi:hypothetical protein